MKGANQDLAATLNALGVDPQAVGNDADPQSLPLIYPELVNA